MEERNMEVALIAKDKLIFTDKPESFIQRLNKIK